MIVVIFCASVLVACSSSAHVVRGLTPSPSYTPPNETVTSSSDRAAASARQRIGRPYTISGRTYYPARDDDYNEVGIASWYGPNFHGRPTANGETFNQWAMTAAHTTLPIPSNIEVTNLENGRSVILRLNDRGPFAHDRILDVSRAAAAELGFLNQGTTRVRVRYLGPTEDLLDGPTPPARIYQASNTSSRYRVQAGAFRDRNNAEAMMRRIRRAGDVDIESARVGGSRVYRVFVGDSLQRSEADEITQRLAALGVHDARIVSHN